MDHLAPLRRPTRTRVRRPGGVLLVLVAVLVLGILGMHALTSHGAGAPPVTGASTVAGRDATQPMAHLRHDAPTTGEASGHHPGQATGAAMVLCMVMLAATALAGLGLLLGRPLRPLRLPGLGPVPTALRPRTRASGSGPPSAWRFSVIRC